MVDKLRPDEMESFKAAFDMFDKNSDGTISTKVFTIYINKIQGFESIESQNSCCCPMM